MTGRSRAASRVTPFAASLPRDARSVVGAIGSATLSRLALIALALVLILVILPAVLGAAGIQAVAAT